MSQAADTIRENSAMWANLKEANPEAMAAFGNLRQSVCKDGGALDFKTLELIAVAVTVARQCDGCMLSHLKCCIDAGVTREELACALGVNILVGGGPGMAQAAKALDAFDQMMAEK